MRFSRQRLLLVFALLVVIAAGALFGLAPRLAQEAMNPVTSPGPYPVAPSVAALHERLLVADLHADSLLWRRDLLDAHAYGHVDLPRLLAGNVAIQAFTAVIRTPTDTSIESNRPDGDPIRLLAVAQLWPPRTWSSPLERARYQAQKLHAFAERSDGRLVVIRERADLIDALARRVRGESVVAAFLGIEGAQALEGDIAAVDAVFAAGYRMLGLAHFYDNEVGGSAHGLAKGGLTPFGGRVIERAEQLGVLVDLAHASPALLDDVLRVASRPVVVSHTGVRGTCDNRRNLADAQLRAIAANGGVVGIGFWEVATCGDDAAAIAGAIGHAVAVMGDRHVALGSDFDGTVSTPFDASGMARITAALLEAGLAESAIRNVMGDNVRRLLLASLPDD